MLINHIATIVTHAVIAYLPLDDVNVKITFSLAISSIFIILITKFWDHIKELKIWNRSIHEKYIIIQNQHQLYKDFIKYLYKKFMYETKGCKMDKTNGSYDLLIDELSKNELVDQFENEKIKIGFQDKTVEKNGTKISEKDIVLRNPNGIGILESYVKNVLSNINSSKNDNISIYKLNVTGGKKNRDIHWIKLKFYTNKTMKNTIVSSRVQKMFYDDIVKFLDSEEYYKSKGLPYKRGYLLYGEPGCGKTSLIKAVSHDLELPIFMLDINIVKNNSELISVINDIGLFVNTNQKYMLIFEDFDRCRLLSHGRYDSESGDSKITKDCFLNIVDGVDECNGRIMVITTNFVNKIHNYNSLIRPGRIDIVLNVTFCTIEQIRRMFSFFFGVEDSYELNKDIVVTPAQIIQMVYLFNDFKKILDMLNTIKNFTEFNIEDHLQVEQGDDQMDEKSELEISVKQVGKNTRIRKQLTYSRSREMRKRNALNRNINRYKKRIESANKLINRTEIMNKSFDDTSLLRLNLQKIKKKILEIQMTKLIDLAELNGLKRKSKSRSDPGLLQKLRPECELISELETKTETNLEILHESVLELEPNIEFEIESNLNYELEK